MDINPFCAQLKNQLLPTMHFVFFYKIKYKCH